MGILNYFYLYNILMFSNCINPSSKLAGKIFSCKKCPNQKICSSGKFRKQALNIKKSLKTVKNVILIMSGKGGVGKSTITAQLAWNLSFNGFRVGVMDVDICGPSIPRMLGKEISSVYRNSEGWIPVEINENLVVMSAQ